MALERFGLGAVITADEKQFVSANNRAKDSLGKFIKTASGAPAIMGRVTQSVATAARQISSSAAQIGTGLSTFQSGLANAAIGLSPLAAGVGLGVAQAASFEKQMSAVGSVTRATEEDLAKLNEEAMRMGIVSTFSATQAGEGMEYLARAGANADQIIAALQGTMNAAAADSIELSTASNIVAQIVKGMGKEWSEAGHVADVLALASASANTNIVQLGESFSYGVAQAVQLGVSLEETTAIFGKLADAGLKGSIAGTSFVNMMNKLVKPSKKARKQLAAWNISLDNADGSMKKVSSITSEIATKLSKIPSATKRAGIATEIFGIRGAKAYGALAVTGKEALDDLESALIASSIGMGAATEMATKRLDNFLGKLVLFKSSVESVSIGIFGPLLKEATPTLEQLTNSLNGVLFSLQGLSEIRQKENQELGASAQLIAKEATNRLRAAGVVDQYASKSLAAMQVLTRMAMGEQRLTTAQTAARKRALQSTLELETKRRAELIKSQHLETAGVAKIDELGKARKNFMQNQIDAMSKARAAAANEQIDLAFSGAAGAADAQKWLKSQVLKQALDSNKELSEADKLRYEQQIAHMTELEAAQSVAGDKLRAQIFGIEKLQEIEEKYGSAAVQIALGVQDAIDSISDAWNGLVNNVKQFGQSLEKYLGNDGVRKLAKYATIFAIAAGAAVPLILGLGLLGFAIKGVVTMLAGLKMVALGALGVIKGALIGLAGAALPITIALAGLALIFAFIRKDGESIGDTLSRVWNGVKTTAMNAYNNMMLVVEGFTDKWQELSGELYDTWNTTIGKVVADITGAAKRIKEKFAEIFGSWSEGLSNVEIDWQRVGGQIATGIVWFATKTAEAISATVNAFVWLMDTVWAVVEGPLTAFKSMADAIMLNWVPVKESFINMWETLKVAFAGVYEEVSGLVNEIVGIFTNSSTEITVDWVELGTRLGVVISTLVTTITETISMIAKVTSVVFGSAVRMITTAVYGIKKVFADVFGGIKKIMEGNFLSGMKQIGIAIFNAITLPFRSAISGLLKLIQAIPGAESIAESMGFNFGAIQQMMKEGLTSDGMLSKMSDKTNAKGKLAKIAGIGAPPKMTPPSIATGAKAEPLAKLQKQMNEVWDIKARREADAKRQEKLEANVNIEDKRVLDIKNNLSIDGESMAVGTARHKQEIQDRAGFKATPWQRRTMIERGAAPMNRQAG